MSATPEVGDGNVTTMVLVPGSHVTSDSISMSLFHNVTSGRRFGQLPGIGTVQVADGVDCTYSNADSEKLEPAGTATTPTEATTG